MGRGTWTLVLGVHTERSPTPRLLASATNPNVTLKTYYWSNLKYLHIDGAPQVAISNRCLGDPSIRTSIRVTNFSRSYHTVQSLEISGTEKIGDRSQSTCSVTNSYKTQYKGCLNPQLRTQYAWEKIWKPWWRKCSLEIRRSYTSCREWYEWRNNWKKR